MRSEFLGALAHSSFCKNEEKKHTKAQLLYLFVEVFKHQIFKYQFSQVL